MNISQAILMLSRDRTKEQGSSFISLHCSPESVVVHRLPDTITVKNKCHPLTGF